MKRVDLLSVAWLALAIGTTVIAAPAPIKSSGATITTDPNNTPSVGASDVKPNVCDTQRSRARTGAIIPNAFIRLPNVNSTASQ